LVKVKTFFSLLVMIVLSTGSVQAQDGVTDLRILTDVGANEIQQLARQAGRGDIVAQRTLGLFYLTGDDPRDARRTEIIGVDPEEAAKWFLMAAEQGDLVSQLRLGLLYHDGTGVPRDFAEAARWLRAPAEEGDVDAQTFMGSVYTRSSATWELDYTEAAKWFRLAADQGSLGSILTLAGLYHNGLGVELDFEEAMELYRQGSDNATAQFNIGTMYRRGEGVSVDFDDAAEWIEKAAEQGHTTAQYELGAMYFAGEGVRKDNVRAHMWVDLAAGSSGGAERTSRIEMRDTIAAEMSPDEIAEAAELRADWRPGR
jgi:TPR repeat protein